ncbi:DUF502 domain-containing protein [Halostella sp. PRR32]|uniref:DUF502 domain-containing protein n=1 Tax=Halostella sp. PRR32 TaxID=3098147 RepID=UPI002B1E5C7B|nr:DUF502 domain-containing protein [Halostella sp. PRR32]
MSRPDVDDIVDVATAEKQEVQRDLKQVFLSGVALTIPFFITILILIWALNVVSNALTPLSDLLVVLGPGDGMNPLIVESMAAMLVFGLIFVVGLAAQHGPDTNLGKRVDTLMADLPGIGSIYTGVERMSDVIVEGDTESFQAVKIVEFPREGSFSLAFLTADTPPEIEEATGEDEMLTVFVPMAPNPVMGGHLLNLPRERVHDVDLSVEEGMQAIMTTGLSLDESVQTETT